MKRKKIFKNRISNRWLELLMPLALIGIIYFLLRPLFRPGFFLTDDAEWMVIRLTAFYQSFREGQFPVRYLGRLNYQYGYPVANFLYPGFMYLGTLIHLLGFTFVDSVKLLFIIPTFVTGLALYFWLKDKYSGLSAFAGAVAAVSAPYYLFDIYKRGSVGEILAMSFGVISFIALERGRYYLLPPAVAMLVISHNTMAVFFMMLIFAYIWIAKLFRSILPVILGVGSTCFFWLVVILEQKYVVFSKTGIAKPFEYFASGENIQLVGFISIACFFGVLVRAGKIKPNLTVWFFMATYAISVFFATPLSAPFWGFSDITRFVQFPFRFLALSILAVPVIVAFVAYNLKIRLRLMLTALIVMFAGYTAYTMQLKLIYFDKPEILYTTNEATTTVADEYLPKWVQAKPVTHPQNRASIISGHADIIKQQINTQVYKLYIRAADVSLLQLNNIYYPGWGVIINGQPAEITFDNPLGLIQVTVPKGNNEVYASFRETPGRFIVDMVSLVCIVISVIYMVSHLDRKEITA